MAIAVIDRKEGGRLLRRRVRVSTPRGRTLSNTKTSEKVAAHTLWRASRRAERSESAASSSASRKISSSRDAQGSVAVTLVVRGAARYVPRHLYLVIRVPDLVDEVVVVVAAHERKEDVAQVDSVHLLLEALRREGVEKAWRRRGEGAEKEGRGSREGAEEETRASLDVRPRADHAPNTRRTTREPCTSPIRAPTARRPRANRAPTTRQS